MPPRARSLALCAILLLAYGVMLFAHLDDVAGGSDSSGYLNEARMIASGKTSERIKPLDFFRLDDSLADLFTPLGYDVTPVAKRVMVPTYPAGLPLHMALAMFVNEKHAPFYVTPIAAIVSLVLIALLANELSEWRTPSSAGAATAALTRGRADEASAPPSIGIAAAIMLASCPVFIFHSIQPVSDVLATMWAIASIYAAVKQRPAIAGAALAIAIWVRPTSVLLAPALLAALPRNKRAYIQTAIAGAIVLAPLLIWNTKLYGGPFRTGYGSFTDMLALHYFPTRAIHYLKWTGVMLTPFAILGAFTKRWLLALWWWPFFLFYCFFESYNDWTYTRFLLPAYPALIIATLLVAQRISPRALPLIIVITALAFGFYFTKHRGVLQINKLESQYIAGVQRSSSIPADALVIAMQMSGARKYYLDDESLRWEWLDADRVAQIEQHVRPDRWYAVLFPFEVDEVRKRVPGEWVKIDEYRDITIWHRIR